MWGFGAMRNGYWGLLRRWCFELVDTDNEWMYLVIDNYAGHWQRGFGFTSRTERWLVLRSNLAQELCLYP